MKKLLLFTAVLISFTAFSQTDLIISEYVEGSGNNKAIEIYNPTSESIDLTSYILVRFSNGESYPANLDPKTTSGGYLELVGSLAAGECHVVVTGQTEDTDFSPACSPELQKLADQLDNDYPAPTYLNGNDAIGLLKSDDGGTYVSVDIFGEIGLGSAMSNSYGWGPVKDSTVTYNSGDTEVTATIKDYLVPAKANDGSSFGPFWMAWSKDHTIIRNADVKEGLTSNPSPFVIYQQWDTLPAIQITDSTWSYKDIWTNLGTHKIEGGNSVNAIDNTPIRVYPNPANGDFFNIASENNTIKSVSLLNAVGQQIKNANNLNTENYKMDISRMGKGVYFVKVEFSNNTTQVDKLVIN